MKDFSYEKYHFILKKIKQHYTIIGPELVLYQTQNSSAFIRHDVDFSLEDCKKIAMLEAKEDIKSTYYIMLGSLFYDPRQKSNLDIIHYINELGHQIGLHYDSDYLNNQYPLNHEQFLNTILEQKHYLEKITGLPVNSFSLHNPTLLSPQTFIKIKENQYYYDMTNVYYKFLDNSIKYCSDSNGYWRYENITDIIDPILYTNLHLLIHPFWWSNPDISPRNKVKYLLTTQKTRILEYYDSILEKENRINI